MWSNLLTFVCHVTVQPLGFIISPWEYVTKIRIKFSLPFLSTLIYGFEVYSCVFDILDHSWSHKITSTKKCTSAGLYELFFLKYVPFWDTLGIWKLSKFNIYNLMNLGNMCVCVHVCACMYIYPSLYTSPLWWFEWDVSPNNLEHLNMWFPVGEIVCIGLGCVALLRGYVTGDWIWDFERLVLFLTFPLLHSWDSRCGISAAPLATYCHICPPYHHGS